MSRPRVLHGFPVHGRVVDGSTRCAHYAGEQDVVAIRFFCCGRWYPCLHCHAEDAAHAAVPWPAAAQGERAILCGACGSTLSIRDYRKASACPRCAASFNPGCALHHHVYFE